MIVVDGRTDEEKLLELLATGTEDTELDFKATVDLSRGSSRSVLEFVKDAISMGNLPSGGYLIIGVDNRGKPAHEEQRVEVGQFDSALLRARIAKYVDAPVHVVAQAHVVDGRDVALIYVRPNESGLPVPIKAIGQYDDGTGAMKTVFSEGEVLIREGTSNVRLRYAHWDGLLSRYRERVRDEARTDVDRMLARLAAQLGPRDQPGAAILLDVGMDDNALTEAIPAAFEAATPVALNRFLNVATHVVAGESEIAMSKDRALDLIAAVACQAALFDRPTEFAAAVDALWNAYQAVPVPADGVRLSGQNAERAAHELDVILRVFAVGAAVVRVRRWSMLGTLVDRPVPVGQGYTYGTWLRHALVQASRASLLLDENGAERGGQVLSLVRRLVAGTRLLRPDRGPQATVTVWEDLAPNDWILNSLCQFDVLWCVLARALGRGNDRTKFYPSCAAFHQYRAQPVLDEIVSDADARRDTFGSLPDDTIAGAITTVLDLAVGQSHNYGGWWGGVEDSPTVARFIADAGVAPSR
ncbi:ATP-binding protein [Cellulosimicrobium terreum]|nr:ATP-binding protein [Cellulosimicrobium terreum]